MADNAGTGSSLRSRAELLASVYERFERPVDAGEWMIPQKDQRGAFIGKVSEKVRPALVLRKGATDLAGAEAEYSEAYRVVTMAVQDAALNAAFFEVFPRQIAALKDLVNRLRKTGIPERLKHIARGVEHRVRGLTPSGDDESKASAKTIAVNPAGERLPPQADPRYESYVQDEFRGRVKAALAAEHAASFRDPVASWPPRPRNTGGSAADSRAAMREAWDLCKVLSLHPRFIDILTAYAASAGKGGELAGALIEEAVAATRLFSATLRNNPEHVWRYSPLLMLGIKRLGLAKVDGFSAYIGDVAVAISHSVLTDVLTVLGTVILVIGLVLSGPFAPLELEAGLTAVAFADFTVSTAQLSLTYIDEREQDLAVMSGGFQPSSQKLADRSNYRGTMLDAVAAILCGIALVFGGAKLLRKWRRPPRHFARLRPPVSHTGISNRMLKRGFERARFRDRPLRPEPHWSTPDHPQFESQRVQMASGMRQPPPEPAPSPKPARVPALESVRAKPAAPAAEPRTKMTDQTGVAAAEGTKAAGRQIAQSQKGLPVGRRSVRDRLRAGDWKTKLRGESGESVDTGKVNVNFGYAKTKKPRPALEMDWEQFEEACNHDVFESFAEDISDRPVRKTSKGMRGYDVRSTLSSNELKLQREMRGRIGDGVTMVRRPDGSMVVKGDGLYVMESTLQTDFEAEIGYAGGKQRQISGTAWLDYKFPKSGSAGEGKMYYNIFCPEQPSKRTVEFLNELIEGRPNLEINWFVTE